jgi:hypothetical protein
VLARLWLERGLSLGIRLHSRRNERNHRAYIEPGGAHDLLRASLTRPSGARAQLRVSGPDNRSWVGGAGDDESWCCGWGPR